MTLLKTTVLCSAVLFTQQLYAHYPYIAPLSYQSFNNNTAVLSGFYDNPFASEVAIKNFKFHYHTPAGKKIQIADTDWVNSKTVSAYSLENKEDGTYRIRGEKQGTSAKFALDDKKWKALLNVTPKANKEVPEGVVYANQLKKNAPVKTVQTLELIETFVSRKQTSDHVIHHLHDGFDVQFISHPNAFKANKPIKLKVLNDKTGIADVNVEILAQTHDFSRDEKVTQSVKSQAQGELNFVLKEKGQYLLKIDYQEPFTLSKTELKRYKYTLSFNVI